ncbi:hypothetical protein BDZ89DRAFT_283176 [Hymenopellis radicata]|nr:hypothetical protein BDZ89DRAFT_283176 [Hymenopellis radicata]
MTQPSFESTPTMEQVTVSPPPMSIPPHSDYYGQIHLVNASLIQPYFDLCQEGFDKLAKEEIYKCGRNKSIRLAHSRVQRSMGNRSPPRAVQKVDSDIPDRPAIVCPPPATKSTPSDMNKAWLFLMGTFGSHHKNAMPNVLKEFAVPIHTRNLNQQDAKESIHTTPPWDANGKRAWVVLIPITTIDGLLPAKRWEGNGATYRVDEANYNKLMAKSRELMKEFNTQAQNPRVLARFINALWNRHHEDGSYVATFNPAPSSAKGARCR